MKDWKQAERRIASILGGVRVPVSGRQRGGAPDIAHPGLAVEVKTRRSLPAWIEEAMVQAEAAGVGKLPIVVLHQDRKPYEDAVVMVRLSRFAGMFTSLGEFTKPMKGE